MELLKTKRSFRKEFKRQIRFAVVAAIGFLIAFSWRNAIFDAAGSFVSRVLDVSPSHYLSEVYTSVFITFMGVLVILITSKLLKED